MPKVNSLKGKGFPYEQQIRFWRAHPDIAAKDLFDVTLDTHQRVVLKNRWSHNTCYDILSRGTGKTFLSAVFASLRGILIPGHRVGLLAPSYRQSKLIFNEVQNLWDRSPVFQEATVRRPSVAPEMCETRFQSAQGQVGSVIQALPMGNDGSKIRGARYFDVICDEYAQMDKEVVDVVIRGFMATGANPMKRVEYMREQHERVRRGEITEDEIVMPSSNKFMACSTAFYQYNHLWQSVSSLIAEMQTQHGRALRRGQDDEGRKPDRYMFKGKERNGQFPHRVMSNGKECIHAFTCIDPSSGFMDDEVIQAAKRDMTHYEFLMEYFSFFPPDSEGFFRRSTLEAARPSATGSDYFGPILEPRQGMLYVMGLDPARESDNFAAAIFEVDVVQSQINWVRTVTWNKKDFPFIQRELYKLIDHYDISYFKMDAGGGGTIMRDLLADNPVMGHDPILERDYDGHRGRVGDRRLGPLVQFSKYEWIHDTNHNMLAALQNRTLRIAGKPTVWSEALDTADEEMEQALTEMSSIVVSSTGQRMRWDTPTKHQRKDRYSAALIGFDAAIETLNVHRKPRRLAMGFFN